MPCILKDDSRHDHRDCRDHNDSHDLLVLIQSQPLKSAAHEISQLAA